MQSSPRSLFLISVEVVLRDKSFEFSQWPEYTRQKITEQTMQLLVDESQVLTEQFGWQLEIIGYSSFCFWPPASTVKRASRLLSQRGSDYVCALLDSFKANNQTKKLVDIGNRSLSELRDHLIRHMPDLFGMALYKRRKIFDERCGL